MLFRRGIPELTDPAEKKPFWLFANRKRITASVLILLIIVGGTGAFFAFNGGFRAFDDSDETESYPGVPYIGNVTTDMFRQKLFELPEEKISEYQKIVILTELSGVDYFVQPTATKRQEALAKADITEEQKALVTHMENESGAIEWLNDLNGRACEPGELGAVPRLLGVEKAQADDGDWCAAQTLAHINALRKQNADPVIVDFAVKWYNFASLATITPPGNPCRNMGVRERMYVKSCWGATDLNELYTKWWPDLKKRRLLAKFNNLEFERIKGNNELYDIINGPVEEWGAKLINARIERAEVVMWAVPLGKVVSTPLKVAAKPVTKLASTSRVLRPIAVGTAIWIARTRPIVHEIVAGSLRGTKANISEMFGKSGLVTQRGVRLATNYKAERTMVAEAANAFDDLLNSSLTKDYISPSRARQLFAKTNYVRPAYMYSLKGVPNAAGTYSGLALLRSGKTFINEERVYHFWKRHTVVGEAEARNMIRKVHTHEYLHHLSAQARFEMQNGLYDAFMPYSKKLNYSPLGEGFTEWFTQEVAKTSGYRSAYISYSREVQVAEEVYVAFIRSFGGSNRELARERGMALMKETYFEKGASVIDSILGKRVVPNSPLARELGKKKLSIWMTEEMEKGYYEKVSDYIDKYIEQALRR